MVLRRYFLVKFFREHTWNLFLWLSQVQKCVRQTPIGIINETHIFIHQKNTGQSGGFYPWMHSSIFIHQNRHMRVRVFFIPFNYIINRCSCFLFFTFKNDVYQLNFTIFYQVSYREITILPPLFSVKKNKPPLLLMQEDGRWIPALMILKTPGLTYPVRVPLAVNV